MADEAKPVTTETATPATAPVAEPATEATAPAAEPAATETPAPAAEEKKTEEAAKPAEESKETAVPKEEVKPIYEGVLRYTPTGNPFKSLFGLKEKFIFYFGDEAVSADKLAHLIKPGKSELKETVAWSSQTGKGILYFVKHADQKASPKGAISLADIDEPKPIGSIEINFKINGQNHDLLAESKAVRDGWLLSLKEKIEEAKGLKEEITGKEGYKEQLEKLSKPAPVAAVIAKTEGSPKKSTDERAPRSEASKARPAKDRSQSRGKKLYAAFLGKKETDAAKDESKAEEAKESTETPAPEAAAPASTEAPATSTETPVAEGAAATPTAAVEGETKAEEPKAEETKEAPKNKTRRTSKFFASFKDAVSPSKEKKQEDLIPPVESKTEEPTAVPETKDVEAAKEAEPAAEAAPATEAAATAPATNGETKAEEAASPTTAAGPKEEKRRSSFFGDVQNKLGAFRAKTEKKAKDAKEEVKPSGEESKTEEPAASAAAPTTAAVAEETKAEEAKPAETTEATEPTETAAKEPEVKPKKENKLFGGVTRSLSKAFRGDKAKKEKVSTPEKVAETEQEETKPAEEAKTAEPVKEAEAPKEAKKDEPAAPNSIGDVVPEAVNVGTAPKPTATVQATA